MLRDLVIKTRSYRRFQENVAISEATLRELVDLARLSGSAGNLQPLKYILSWTPEKNAKIFPTLGWARYLKEWGGPKEGERPTGYIIILGDKEISQSFFYDTGIVCQTMLLGAMEKGLGGCMIATVDRVALRRELAIPEKFEIGLVVALGKPAETVVIDPVAATGEIKYWRDEKSVHHVPKRALADIIVG
jgi:nitroreductase